MKCTCYWCINDKSHPNSPMHVMEFIGRYTTVANSLAKKDQVDEFACRICGHTERKAAQ